MVQKLTGRNANTVKTQLVITLRTLVSGAVVRLEHVRLLATLLVVLLVVMLVGVTVIKCAIFSMTVVRIFKNYVPT